MINPHFPSLAFVAGFLAAFGRLDPFNPSLMYLWCVKGDQIPVYNACKKWHQQSHLWKGRRRRLQASDSSNTASAV
jgi:hypothetical protein